jgi:hypothetical protein
MIDPNQLKELQRSFEGRVQGAVAAGRRAQYQAAEVLMTDVKEHYVPVATGTLRNSGHVTPPQEEGSDTSVDLVFGGPAAPYAVYVHEDLKAKHTVGQAKYLESPALAYEPKLRDAVVAAVKEALL